jgi:predicted TPR repeat methyltransferase
LGVAQKKLNKKNEAISSFTKYLEFHPNSNAVIHQIDLLKGNCPETSPAEFIEDVFNSYAYRFEEHLLGSLNYAGPKAIKRI